MARLAGRVILVVEVEALIADEVGWMLEQAGAYVFGPVGTVAAALALLTIARRLDGAVLNLNLHEEAAYPLADTLEARGVPYLFLTGYPGEAIPDRYQHVPRCGKPVVRAEMIETMAPSSAPVSPCPEDRDDADA
jgi:CheY-like chemotaxis protein